MLLYKYGGLYMDLDFTCLKDLDTVPLRTTPGRATLVLQRKSVHDHEAVSNAFMAAPPGHPFFRLAVEQLASSASAKHVLDATGPRYLTRVWRAYQHRLGAGFTAAVSGATGRVGADGSARTVNYTASMRFEPWALLHRVHSCRREADWLKATAEGKPPCTGPWNFAPCKKGRPSELDRCALTLPNVSVTTFWTGSWVNASEIRSRG